MMKAFDMGVEYMETNLNLETNDAVISRWKSFNAINLEKRRVYFKAL